MTDYEPKGGIQHRGSQAISGPPSYKVKIEDFFTSTWGDCVNQIVIRCFISSFLVLIIWFWSRFEPRSNSSMVLGFFSLWLCCYNPPRNTSTNSDNVLSFSISIFLNILRLQPKYRKMSLSCLCDLLPSKQMWLDSKCALEMDVTTKKTNSFINYVKE